MFMMKIAIRMRKVLMNIFEQTLYSNTNLRKVKYRAKVHMSRSTCEHAEIATYCINTVKRSVPIRRKEIKKITLSIRSYFRVVLMSY